MNTKGPSISDMLSVAASAARSSLRAALKYAFSAEDAKSRANPGQEEILQGIKDYLIRVVKAGNQSIPGWSPVSMADGSTKPIADIKVGDKVWTFDFATQLPVVSTVTAVWNHGIKEVIRYKTSFGYADRTDYHEMVVSDGDGFKKVKAKDADHFISLNPSDWEVHSVTDETSLGFHQVYDITVDHPDHNYVCDGYVTGNSGKSRTCARDLTWFLNREHPYIDVTAEWGNGPLLALVAGADRTILTTNIWQQMIKPLLADPTEWKENNSNDGIKSAINRRTGDQIVFLTHNKGSEEDIRHLMSYASHYVWIDEIPKTTKVIEELTRRIDAKRGRLIMSYTMKFRNDAMRKSIAAMDPAVTKLYRLAKLDNPIYADRKEEELAKISHLSKEEQAVILYGDDILSDTAIHSINYDIMVKALPPTYDTAWPHVCVVDPATESKLGMLVAAYQQSTGLWYIVQAGYVEGLYAPSKIVAEVERRLIGLNIIGRFYDTAASWYKREAKVLGFNYKPIKEKAGSKERWIMETNEALGTRLIITDYCAPLLDELEQYQRVPGSTNIQNPKRFHLCVTADTSIWTSCGPKPITDIKVGDMVWTHKGRLRPVTRTWQVARDLPLHELDVNSRELLRITSNHPVLMAEFKRTAGNGLTGQLRPTGNSTWVDAGLVTKEKPNSQIRNFVVQPKIGLDPSTLKDDTYFLYGYYLAEGSYSLSAGQIGFAGHVDETGVLPLIESQFPDNKVVYRHIPGTNGRVLYVNSTKAAKVFAEFGSRTLKSLPAHLMPITAGQAMSLFCGWLYGDGHFVRGKNLLIGSSVSWQLARQLQYCAALAGLHCALRFVSRKGRWKSFDGLIENDAYAVSVSADDSTAVKAYLLDNFPFVIKEKLNATDFTKQIKPTKRHFDAGPWEALTLVANTEIQDPPSQDGMVYTLSVEEDNSYVANGIAVKNCDCLHYLVESLPDMPAPAKDVTYWEHFHAAVTASNQRKRDKIEAKIRDAKKGRVMRVAKRGYSSWK